MFFSLRRLLSVLLLALSFAAIGSATTPWKADFDPRYGLSLRYEDVPVIRQSTLYIVSPEWNPVLYNQEQVHQQIERTEGPGGQGLIIQGENEFFSSRYQMEALDEHTYRIVFEGELKKDVPARIEYAAGYFNAHLIAGVPFRGKTPSKTVEGRVPDFPTSFDQHANDLLPGFNWLEFESRLGKLRVEVEADDRQVMFFDSRREPQGWATLAPVFWSGLGAPARPLPYGQLVRVVMTLTIVPDKDAPSEVAIVSARSRKEPAAESPNERPVQIIPTPKSAEIGALTFVISPETHWEIRQPKTDPRLEQLLLTLTQNHDLTLSEGQHSTSADRVEILLGEPEIGPVSADAPWMENPEGYRLTVSPGGIAILSSTSQGAFYGLQSLSQLMRPSEEGIACHSAAIEDWPSMRFRGAHWFPSASGVPFHEKLIERVMARYKMNQAVIQCEAARWESHPEIAGPNSIHTEDLQKLVDLSRQNFINPIPLINIPGHAEWIFRNGQNRDIVEDPELPYAYCVNHPGSYTFIEDILSEAIEIFQPSVFHLGHDEVTMLGRFPNPDCPRCHDKTTTELVLQHLHRLEGWLDKQEIETMIWGDMMLAKAEIPDTAAFAPNLEEAIYRRNHLPDDTIIADWHYYNGDEYPSLTLFQEAGHPAIASTWYRPDNIYHFAQAALQTDDPALLQTTWAGFFPDETGLKTDLHQYSAFILAAEYAWSGRSEPPLALPFEAGTEFTRSYYGTGEKRVPGRLVEIEKTSRTPRTHWLGLSEGWGFSDLPVGEARLEDILFNIPENLTVIGGRLAPDSAWQRTSFVINQPAAMVALLNAAAFAAPPGTPAVRMTVTYADDTTDQSNLAIGSTTAAWNDSNPATNAPVAWQKASPANTPIALRITRWINPHPEKTISRIDFDALPDQAWILAGMTLLE